MLLCVGAREEPNLQGVTRSGKEADSLVSENAWEGGRGGTAGETSPPGWLIPGWLIPGPGGLPQAVPPSACLVPLLSALNFFPPT